MAKSVVLPGSGKHNKTRRVATWKGQQQRETLQSDPKSPRPAGAGRAVPAQLVHLPCQLPVRVHLVSGSIPRFQSCNQQKVSQVCCFSLRTPHFTSFPVATDGDCQKDGSRQQLLRTTQRAGDGSVRSSGSRGTRVTRILTMTCGFEDFMPWPSR